METIGKIRRWRLVLGESISAIARERRTAQRLYEGLCLEGYTGAADAER